MPRIHYLGRGIVQGVLIVCTTVRFLYSHPNLCGTRNGSDSLLGARTSLFINANLIALSQEGSAFNKIACCYDDLLVPYALSRGLYTVARLYSTVTTAKYLHPTTPCVARDTALAGSLDNECDASDGESSALVYCKVQAARAMWCDAKRWSQAHLSFIQPARLNRAGSRLPSRTQPHSTS